jgi:mono/diheme cytochrome c family protein
LTKKSKRKRARQKSLEAENATPPKSKKKFIGLACVALLGAGLYALFAPGGLLKGADPGDKELVALGQGVYRDSCASCHGAKLEGQANWRAPNADGTLKAPPHDESGHTWHHPDKVLFDYTKKGGAEMAPPGFKSAMPGFGEDLKDGEIWAVLAFIKSRWPKEVLARQRQINARGGQLGG